MRRFPWFFSLKITDAIFAKDVGPGNEVERGEAE
jgi:hypothetical protein